MPERHLRTRGNSFFIRDVLQTLFTAELIKPSRCLWVISPWISDIEIIDNRDLGFSFFEPKWEGRWICLSEILANSAIHRGTVRVVTRSDSHNRIFRSKVEQLLSTGAEKYCLFHETDSLHEKGILGDHFYLSGSMNLTSNGLTMWEEKVTLSNDEETISKNRISLQERWGGPVDDK